MKKFISTLCAIALLISVLTGCKDEPRENSSLSKNSENSVSTPQKGPEGDLSSIIDKIYEKKKVDLSLVTSIVDITDGDMLKYNTGLESAENLKEVSVSEPMMSSQAYSLVLVRIKEDADAKAVAKQMLDGIDQRKWICVEADTIRVVGCSDVVMLIMVSSELSDVVNVDQIVQAFEAVGDCTLSVDLK